jgi:hypothetical protein
MLTLFWAIVTLARFGGHLPKSVMKMVLVVVPVIVSPMYAGNLGYPFPKMRINDSSNLFFSLHFQCQVGEKKVSFMVVYFLRLERDMCGRASFVESENL